MGKPDYGNSNNIDGSDVPGALISPVVPKVADCKVKVHVPLVDLQIKAFTYKNPFGSVYHNQQVDLFGPMKQDLPDIWEELVNSGFESGHAYGKGLRLIKSCMGTTWCRYGVGDGVGIAVQLEDRYKNVNSPHKIKGGLSGYVRECAEAKSKGECHLGDQGQGGLHLVPSSQAQVLAGMQGWEGWVLVDPEYSIITFDTKGEDGDIYLKLPSGERLDDAIGKSKWMVKKAATDLMGRLAATATKDKSIKLVGIEEDLNPNGFSGHEITPAGCGDKVFDW